MNVHRRRIAALTVGGVLFLVSQKSRADDTADFTREGEVASGQVTAHPSAPTATPSTLRQYHGQRNFAVLATAGSAGFGLGARAGAQRVGLELSGGWQPLLETYRRDQDLSFKFFSTLQANAMAYCSFYRSTPVVDMGIATMYQYNTVLHHGAGLSFYVQYDLSDRWALHFVAGLVLFPKAEQLLRATGRFAPDGSITNGLPSVRGGLGLDIAFFP